MPEYTASRSKKVVSKKFMLLAIIAIAVVVGIIAILHLRAVHKAQRRSGGIPTASKVKTTPQKPATTNKTTSKSSSKNTTVSSSQKTPSTVVASSALVAPSGSFVSNHHPGKNGTSTQLESLCTTTPGATCYIKFEKDGITKRLDTQTVDGSGNAIWGWDTKGANLSSGSWKITAVASLNGSSLSTVDPNGLLEVE